MYYTLFKETYKFFVIYLTLFFFKWYNFHIKWKWDEWTVLSKNCKIIKEKTQFKGCRNEGQKYFLSGY